jgi:hypothetical protein
MIILFCLFITTIFFDPNFYFANSLSRVLFVLIVFLSFLFSRNKKLIISKGILYLIALWGLFIISWLVKSGDEKIVILFLEVILVYILTFNLITDENKAVTVLKTIVNVGFILEVIAIIEYLFFAKINTYLNFFRTAETGMFLENNILRVSATFINPIYLSFAICVTILIAQSLFINSKCKRLYYGLVCLLGFVVLLLTKSEGGIIAFLIAECFFISTYKKVNITKLIRLGTIGVTLVATIIIIGSYLNIISLDVLINIFTKRTYAWIVSITMLKDDLFFGCGVGNFNAMFINYGSWFIEHYYFQKYSTHSDFFYVATSAGIIALVVFVKSILYYLKLIKVMFKDIFKANINTRIILWVSSLIIIYFSLHRMVDDFFVNYRTITIYYIICAIFESCYYRKRKSVIKQDKKVKVKNITKDINNYI